MSKDIRRALLVAKNLLPERPIEAHPAFSSQFARRDDAAPADDKYRGPYDTRKKVWANRPGQIVRGNHILDGKRVITPEDQVLEFPTREHAVDYIDRMVGHSSMITDRPYADGGSVAKRRALMVAKDVLPFDSPERQANLEKHMEGSKTPPVLYHATHADVPEFKKMKGSHLGFHFGDRDSALERLEDTTAPHVDLGEVRRVHEESEKRYKPFAAYQEELRRKDREIPTEEFVKALEASGDDLSGPALRDLFDKYRYQPTDEENAKLQALKEHSDQYKFQMYGTGANVGAYHVSIKNPLRMYDVGNWGDVGAVKKHLPFPTNARSLDQIRREIQDRGYDGVVYKNRVENRIMGTDSFIAFDPEQIKSATGNAGTFSPESPRVNEARGGAVHPASQIPGVHISERIHGKPIFTEEREGRADGGTVFPDQTQADEGITAYQGGPHSVGPEGYDNAKIGTGEGAAAYGHGHYFAEAEPVAQGYRDRLGKFSPEEFEKLGVPADQTKEALNLAKSFSKTPDRDMSENAARLFAEGVLRKPFNPELHEAFQKTMAQKRGHMHQVLIKGKPEHFFDWDALLDEQSPHVMKALQNTEWFDGYREAAEDRAANRGQNPTGADLMRELWQDWEKPEVSEMMAQAGIRGVRHLDQFSRKAGKGTRNYVVFDPKHIDIQRRYARGGMAYADGGSLPDPSVQKALDLTRDLNPQGLYSHAAEAALASPQAKGPLPQMLASLKGVKPDEMKYSGVEQAFAGQPQVTREQLAQHFQKSLPNIQETTLREGGNEGRSRYDGYTLPGGENYREVLLHLPLKPNHNYQHSHWAGSAPNILAHLRLKDRTGPDGEKILHAEEIQSDWGQEARKKGTYDPTKPYQVFHPTIGKILSEHASEREARAEASRRYAAGEDVDHGNVLDMLTDERPPPTAPYINKTQNWTDLALKRLLHEAAMGGYDKVVWTPGAEQAKRYGKADSSGMEGYYDEIVPKSLLALAKQHDPEAKLDVHNVKAMPDGDDDLYNLFINHNYIETEPTGEYGEPTYVVTSPSGEHLGRFDDEIDAHSKVNEYLSQVLERPDLSRYLREQLGAEQQSKANATATFPGLTITPRMRESILKKGFKAYARGGDVEGTMRIAKAGGGPLGDDEAVKKALALTANQKPSAFFEIAPGKTYHPALQERWEALHPDDKAAISKRMVEEFLPRWQKMSGVRGHVKAGHGGFGGFTNPNYTFHPDDPADMQRSLHDLGDLFSQDAMMGAHAHPFEGSFPAGVVRVHMPKGVSPDEIHRVYKELNERGLAEGHSTDPEAGTMDILAGSGGEDTEQHAKAVADHLNGRYDVSSYPAHVAFPEHGADYGLSGTQTSGSPGTPVSEAHNNLRAEASQRLEGLVSQAHAQRGGAEGFADGGNTGVRPPFAAGSQDTVQRALDLTSPARMTDHPAWIPTRLATSRNALNSRGRDIVDMRSFRATPALFTKNTDLLREYPNVLASMADAPNDDVAEGFVRHATRNLLALHDAVPEHIRNRSKLWYDGARAIVDKWSQEFNLPDHSIAGVLAALSPQKDWYQNVSLARRVLEATRGQGDNFYHGFVFSPEMEQAFRSRDSLNKPKYDELMNMVRGKSLGDIDRTNQTPEAKAVAKALWVRMHDEAHGSPEHRIITPEGNEGDFVKTAAGENAKVGWGSLNEISKAILAIDAAHDPAALSQLMGSKHKVRNFYNNILVPNSRHGDITADTHAVAAALYRPLSGKSLEVAHNFANHPGGGLPAAGGSSISGVQGTYPLYAEAYRRAARARGILPREMQSITWEAIRGLFPDTFKTAKNKDAVDAVWNQYRQGSISQPEARRRVDAIAGGIRNPTWHMEGPAGPNEGSENTADPRELSGTGASGPSPTGTDPGAGGGSPSPVPQERLKEAHGGLVSHALRLASQYGQPLPDAVNLARQHTRGRP